MSSFVKKRNKTMIHIEKQNIDYTLYLVTDRSVMSASSLEQAVEQAIQGGCTVVQLREKDASSREFFETAQRVKQITDHYHIPLIINDRADICLAVNAAGVHVGQQDLPASTVRSIVGPDKIIGVSAAALSEAIQAEQDGADYLGVGAMFATSTKTNTRPVTIEQLAQIKQAVHIPVVAIGGIQSFNAGTLTATGIDGIAVVSAILAKENIAHAAQQLKTCFIGAKHEF